MDFDEAATATTDEAQSSNQALEALTRHAPSFFGDDNRLDVTALSMLRAGFICADSRSISTRRPVTGR